MNNRLNTTKKLQVAADLSCAELHFITDVLTHTLEHAVAFATWRDPEIAKESTVDEWTSQMRFIRDVLKDCRNKLNAVDDCRDLESDCIFTVEQTDNGTIYLPGKSADVEYLRHPVYTYSAERQALHDGISYRLIYAFKAEMFGCITQETFDTMYMGVRQWYPGIFVSKEEFKECVETAIYALVTDGTLLGENNLVSAYAYSEAEDALLKYLNSRVDGMI